MPPNSHSHEWEKGKNGSNNQGEQGMRETKKSRARELLLFLAEFYALLTLLVSYITMVSTYTYASFYGSNIVRLYLNNYGEMTYEFVGLLIAAPCIILLFMRTRGRLD